MIPNTDKSARNNNLRIFFYKIYLNFAHIVNLALFPPAKVLFVFWTLCWIIGFSSLEKPDDSPLFEKVLTILFGYILFCASANKIYRKKQEKYNDYEFKIYQKRYIRLEKLNRMIEKDINTGGNVTLNAPKTDIPNEKKSTITKQPEQKMRENKSEVTNEEYIFKRAKELENIINTTVKQSEFGSSLNELTNLLYHASQNCDLELCNHFQEELNRISKNRTTYFDLFYQRKSRLNSPKRIDEMSGLEFEVFCAKLLQKNGFTNVTVTKASSDHGIDILAEKDDITYAIQCKCYSSDIGNAAVQQAHTGKSLYHKDIAVVMTNRHFTPQAIEEADALGVKLWDRDKINVLIGKNSENELFSVSTQQNFDLDAFAAQCNSYLEHEDG